MCVSVCVSACVCVHVLYLCGAFVPVCVHVYHACLMKQTFVMEATSCFSVILSQLQSFKMPEALLLATGCARQGLKKYLQMILGICFDLIEVPVRWGFL